MKTNGKLLASNYEQQVQNIL